MNIDFSNSWKIREVEEALDGVKCTCKPPFSSIPSICKKHCTCNYIRYIPAIDGQCRRCGRYPNPVPWNEIEA